MRVPQTYYPRESPVHRADARVKLVLLIVATIVLFVSSTWRGMGVLAIAVFAVIAASRLPVGVLFRSLIPFYFLMAFAVAVNSLGLSPSTSGAYGAGGVSAGVFAGAAPIALAGGWYFLPEGMARSLFYCTRILLMVLASLVVAYSTPPTRLSAGFGWFIRPLQRFGVPVDDIALVFTLALRFIPLAFERLQQVRLAQMARGARFQVGSLVQRVGAWGPVVIPWLVSLYRAAGRMAVAMDARAYGLGGTRTMLNRLTLRPADVFLLLLGFAVCIAPCLVFG